MAKQLVNVGTSGNKGDGDTLRASFTKINSNFTEVYDDIADLKDGVVATNVTGDLTGSVFAQDSTLLVDAVTGKLVASALTGTVPAGVVVWSNISGTPDSLAEYGITDAYTKAQVEQLVAAPGDVKGSIFADDSTLLVDGVNGTIPAANLSGALPALDASALTNIDAANITGSLSGVAVSTADITGYGVFTGTEETFATLTGATGTVTHDCDNGHIFYHTTPAADWTANFTNLGLTAEHATTLSIVIAQGATAYIPSAVEIGGVAQTLLWQGGSAPSGTADGTDVVAFSILNDGGTYVVMGQLVGFS